MFLTEGNFNEYDILKGAPNWFLTAFTEIEDEKNNPSKAAEIALAYLKEHSDELFNEIEYKDLIPAMNNPESKSLSFWRNMYLIERSIKPTKKEYGLHTSWSNRLRWFCNTYTAENYIVNHIRVPKEITTASGKLYFVHGRNEDIDHTKLVAGPGKEAADFTFYDEKSKFVDAKRLKDTETINALANNYKEKYHGAGSRHGAEYIIAYNSDLSKFYFIDYTSVEPNIIEVYPKG